VSIIVIAMLLSACSTLNIDSKQILGNAIGSTNNTEVAYGQQCFALQQQCMQQQGHFEQWQTSDEQPGCSCKQ
jgi:hypothetical protein